MSYPHASTSSNGEQQPQWNGFDALLSAFQAAEAQSQSASGASPATAATPAAPPPPAHGTLDHAALQHILSNPALLSTVISLLPPHMLPSSLPAQHEPVLTRSGRPSRPPVLQEEQLLAQIQEIWDGLGLDPAMLSQASSGGAGAGAAQAPQGFGLPGQLGQGSTGGAQTFVSAATGADLASEGVVDWWWPMQEEGEEEDPSYVPPPEGTSDTPAFSFSPAAEGEFLSSIGLNADGTTPTTTTSALYAPSPRASTHLSPGDSMNSALRPPRPLPSPGAAQAGPNLGAQPTLAVSSQSTAEPRALRMRKKARVDGPPASSGVDRLAPTAQGAAAPAPAVPPSTHAGSNSDDDDDDDGATSIAEVAAAPSEGVAKKKPGRRALLTKEEAAERRRARNRSSALVSRQRAKNKAMGMEAENAELKARVEELEKELASVRAELQKVYDKPSFAPPTKVYYNTPNIYDPASAVPGSTAPEHPFAQLPPTPVKRKRGRPKKMSNVQKAQARREAEAAAAAATPTAAGASAAASSSTGLATIVSGASQQPSAADDDDDEEEAEFTDGESGQGSDGSDEDMDDSDDGDFDEHAPVVHTPSKTAASPPPPEAPGTSPSSQASAVPINQHRTHAASNNAPGSTPANTSDVSDSSGDEDDQSSDFEKADGESDFDPTEDLYLPIRDVPFPNPPPDSPSRQPPIAASLASPARMAAAGASANNPEVVDLLKLLLAKLGGESSQPSS